uniref:Uncharacterized protein n=1 Tax=Anguilla anguilla TaxID=7936 RepID=A0A0E9VVL8_ANGAN
MFELQGDYRPGWDPWPVGQLCCKKHSGW